VSSRCILAHQEGVGTRADTHVADVWSDGTYEVFWLSGDTAIHGDSFEVKEGQLIR
jgi:hypothetical protein